MGGGWYTPPWWFIVRCYRWVPQTGWFFMSLFLAILELSWTGHFCIFFWKSILKFTEVHLSDRLSVFQRTNPIYFFICGPIWKLIIAMESLKNMEGFNTKKSSIWQFKQRKKSKRILFLECLTVCPFVHLIWLNLHIVWPFVRSSTFLFMAKLIPCPT